MQQTLGEMQMSKARSVKAPEVDRLPSSIREKILLERYRADAAYLDLKLPPPIRWVPAIVWGLLIVVAAIVGFFTGYYFQA
jgi:hypothetical protein